jgi:hypothetical protein
VIKFGSLVRFKDVYEKLGDFATAQHKVGRNQYGWGVLLGVVGAKESLPDVDGVTSRMNDLGWISTDQIIEALGSKEKAQKFFDKATGRKPIPTVKAAAKPKKEKKSVARM